METNKQYKRVPFDIELAKKIQSGEVEGRIACNADFPLRILCLDMKDLFHPIVALMEDSYGNETIIRYDYKGSVEEEKLNLCIELPEETPKHEFKVGDKVAYAGIIGYVVKIDKNLVDIDPIICDIFHNVNISNIEFVDESQPTKTKHNFKPFDKVLVRDYISKKWYADFYSHATEGGKYHCIGLYNVSECIPFAGNEHLAGTTDKPKED